MTKSQAINYLCSLGISGERIREVVKALEEEPKTDILDKIRTEVEQTAKDYDKFDDYRRVRGLWIALEIIDKYRKEG